MGGRRNFKIYVLKIVEILDTDEGGRLVFGDILYHAQTKYKSEYMMDIAPLSGAIGATLGFERVDIFKIKKN